MSHCVAMNQIDFLRLHSAGEFGQPQGNFLPELPISWNFSVPLALWDHGITEISEMCKCLQEILPHHSSLEQLTTLLCR